MELAPQDAFFGSEEALWKSLSRGGFKNAALLTLHAQIFLDRSFSYESIIVTNGFPDPDQVPLEGKDIRGLEQGCTQRRLS